MRGRLFATLIALGLVLPVTGVADDTPWGSIKKLLDGPVSGLKQRLDRGRQPPSRIARQPAPAPAPTPIPRPRPEIAIPFAAVPSPSLSESAVISAFAPPQPALIVPRPAVGSTCGAVLAGLGVESVALAPISEGQCSVAKPVAIAALAGGATDLTTKAIADCALAETLATWFRDTVQPKARAILGGEVTGLRIAASYACRTRNGISGAKLSEHGRGNAIDISAFRVGGRNWIEVGGAHSHAEARFLTAIRGAACGPFTTVLGPGSDEYHTDHFHLDLAARNKGGRSRGLYCK